MDAPRREKSFLKALGPGLLWAGAAVGVSHLVQSTRAGASFGFSLLLIVLLANILKYPAFSFGPRYAAATGTSLLEGYRRRGTWALVIYAIMTLGTMLTVQAAVTVVTGAIAARAFGWTGTFLGQPTVLVLSLLLTLFCAGLLVVGHYKVLDKIVKVVVVVLTLSTFSATALVLPKIDWSAMSFWPQNVDLTTMLFIVALVGWMPSAFDISIWHSLWTLARRRETKYAPSVKESMLDFNIGYLGTVLLALCFLTLGAGVMFGSGETFSDKAAGFAGQVITLYTKNLGAWSAPVITVAALTVMFSTTLTVIDGYPRALACLVARFREAEVPDHPSAISQKVYWGALVVLGIGALAVIKIGLGSAETFKSLIDLATTLSFLVAPALAFLNHRAMVGEEVPAEHRPGPKMVIYSWLGIIFSLAFALYFLSTLLFN
jgi:Mn2+/Fe2+ NRAMP family transporter